MTISVILIALVSLIGSFLTFFSGFGLGTLLLPVFTFFFPIEIAITLTAIVHLINNIFKTTITFKDIDFSVVKNFGITSIIGAIIGSILVIKMATYFNPFRYQIMQFSLETSFFKIIIGLLVLVFTILEFINMDQWIKPNKKTLLLGGLVSGFFGGLSGHQGALRTLFLSKLKLDKFGFISSGIAIALLVDIIRIPIYLSNFDQNSLNNGIELSVTAICAALVGAVIGKKFLSKIKIKFIYRMVSFFLIFFSLAFSFGII